MRLALFMLLVVGCTPGRAAPCDDTTTCAENYVCAPTSSPGIRRCLLRCAADPQASCNMPVSVGMLCADGSICMDSAVGPVCYFVGGIPIGHVCPDPSCDPSVRICDCEPGTICHEGTCRQVCNAHPRCPDTPGVIDPPPVVICDVGEVCVAGVCL